MMAQLEADYTVERLVPENKDWNDDLTTVMQEEQNAKGAIMPKFG